MLQGGMAIASQGSQGVVCFRLRGGFAMLTRRFALIFGVVFVLLGLIGFLPTLTRPHSHPDMDVNSGLGLALGLFAVNPLLNLIHLAFGGWGLAAARSTSTAVVYARTVAIVFAVLAVMGLIASGNLHTTFGYLPLYGHDVWLHALLAVIAGYVGFMREEPAPAQDVQASP